jgi:hypothetical protein
MRLRLLARDRDLAGGDDLPVLHDHRPKTVPAGRVGRVVFGILVAIGSVLLMAPQTDEFGTKVALLAGLVVLCAARPLLDRLVPQPGAEGDGLRGWAATAGPLRGPARLGAAGLIVAVVGAGVFVAGTPARGMVLPNAAEALNRPLPVVDPSTLPPITVDQEVIDFDHELAGTGMQRVVVSLAQTSSRTWRCSSATPACLPPWTMGIG